MLFAHETGLSSFSDTVSMPWSKLDCTWILPDGHQSISRAFYIPSVRIAIWDGWPKKIRFLLYPCYPVSRRLASASWSPSCFSKVLGGWNLQSRETSQLTTPPLPPPFTSGLVVGSTPPGTRSVTAPARSLVSTLYTSHSGVHTLHAKLYTPHLTRYTPQYSTLDMLHLPVNALYTPHFTCSTLHFTPYTLHSTFDMLHLTVNALYTPHFTHLYTLNLTLHTLHSKLYASHFALRTPQSTLVHPHCTLGTPHYVHTWHSYFNRVNLYALALYTLHFTLDPHNFALFTLDTVWNLGLAPLSCCVRASTCRRKLSPRTA